MEEPAATPIQYVKRLVREKPDDLVAMYGMDSRCVYASPSHEAILGYKATEVVGRPWTDFVAPEDHSHAELAGTDAMLNGESVSFAFNAMAESGDRIRLRGTAKIMVDPPTRHPFLIFQAQVVNA